MPQLQRELPGSIQLIPTFDRSQSIVNSLHDVQATLVIAFVLVIFVIFVFLGRASDTLIPMVALPMSFLITFIAMWVLGYSINNLTLMALTLAIGFLVDDAIVFLENVVRRAEAGESIYKATLNSAGEISFTILSMTLSLAAVFIPLAFMPGLLGRIFREFAITIIVAILASGLVSLTLTPLMCSRILAERGPGHRQDLDGANLQPLLRTDCSISTAAPSIGFSITAGSRCRSFSPVLSASGSSSANSPSPSCRLATAGRFAAFSSSRKAPRPLSNAELQEQARSHSAGESGGRQIFHGRGTFRTRRGCFHRALFEGRERARPISTRWRRELRKACSEIPGSFPDAQSTAGLADQHWSDRELVRALQLCLERHQSR